MQTLLFFDDWLLESHIDIERCWAQAEMLACPDPTHWLPARAALVLDSSRGRFLAWAKELGQDRATLHESGDGLRWAPTGQTMVVPSLQNFPFESGWYFDPWERLPSRRFKMVGFPYPAGIEGGPGLLAFSADGVHWRWQRRTPWFTHANGSDTTNNLFYNPLTRRWCVVCRRYNADRRVALVESSDLCSWTEPEVIVHPDAADPAVMQIYGMAAAPYEAEYFVGAIQCYHVPHFDRFSWTPRIKMQGSVDGQLVYSHDGRHWLRSNRLPLVPRPAPGTPGSACVYPHAIFTHPDPQQGVLIYSLGSPVDHGACGAEAGLERMLLHRLRRDGFVYLQPRGGTGQLTTRTLVPRAPCLSLNHLGPSGEVRAQVTTPEQTPIPGYSFDECQPLRGDSVAAPVRWRERPDLAGLVGQPVRLQIRLADARLYAIRLHCGLWYSNTPAPLDHIGV